MADYEHQWHVHVSWEARYHLAVAGKQPGDNGMCPYALPPIVRSTHDNALVAARAAIGEVAVQHRDSQSIEAAVYRVVIDADSTRVIAQEQRYTVTMQGEYPTGRYSGPRQETPLPGPLPSPDAFIESRARSNT